MGRAAAIQTTISGVPFKTLTNSLLFTSELDGRSVCEFAVRETGRLTDSNDNDLYDVDNELLQDVSRPGGVDTFITRGQPVSVLGNAEDLYDSDDEQLTDSDDEILQYASGSFIGFVEMSDKIPIARDEYIFKVTCVDQVYLADKRIVAFSAENEYAGSMVRYIVDNWLYEEGITYNASSIEDGSMIKEAVFNYVSAGRALDALAENSGFWWRINESRVLEFKSRTSEPAPFTLTRAHCIGKPQIKSGNPLYRNIQYIAGGTDTTSEQVEEQFGDGSKRAFVVPYELVRVPTVEIDRGSGYVAETVGILGVELAQWYWNKGSNTISQQDGEAVLSATDKIRITYYGGFDIIGVSEDPGAVAAQKAIEGGNTSGKVEAIDAESAISGYEAILDWAGYRIAKYAQNSTTLQFVTRTGGLRAGQLLQVSGFEEFDLDGSELLVTRVETSDKDGMLFHKVDACVGPAHQSWSNFFRKLDQKTKPEIKLGIADSRSLLLPTTFTRTWLFADRPNIFLFDFPSDTLFPSATQWANFTPGAQISYATVHDGATERDRRAPTQIVGMNPTSEQIQTMTYYSPTDIIGDITHFGWAGGALATAAADTPTVFDKQAKAFTKTALEALQIMKYDIKGW